jgi:hypothetical protein
MACVVAAAMLTRMGRVMMMRAMMTWSWLTALTWRIYTMKQWQRLWLQVRKLHAVINYVCRGSSVHVPIHYRQIPD